tara:strand:- start:132 stop:1238 length:1107 start_codon:yes stop_codon:yes gene_type:complete
METGIEWKLQAQRGIWGARQIGGGRTWRSLGTRDEEEAKLLFLKKYGTGMLPEENNKHLAMGKAHLNLVNPMLTQYTFGDLYKKWCSRGNVDTKRRKREDSQRGILALLKDYKLCDYSVEGMISSMASELPVTTRKQLGQLQRLAYKLGWIMMNFVQPIHLEQGKHEKRKTRAISDKEFDALIADVRSDEPMQGRNVAPKYVEERANYYLLLKLTGAAQTDGVLMKAENIDWKKKELVYHRRKTGSRCALQLSPSLEKLLRSLPQEGFLFPLLSQTKHTRRAEAFRRTITRLGFKRPEELRLHSFRYAMAEWYAKNRIPIREAQVALGHASKTVAQAYAKHAVTSAVHPENMGAARLPDIIDGASLVA